MSALKVDDVVPKAPHLERHPLQRTCRGEKSWVFSARQPDRHPAVRLSDGHDGYARSNAHRAHRGQVPDGRAMEAQPVLCSDIDVVAGKGRGRVRRALEFDEVVQGPNRFKVVSGAALGEPRLLIHRIAEMS